MAKSGLLILTFILGMFVIYSNVPDSFSESSFVETDKPIYLDGEVIKVSGTVPKFKTYPITIEIIDPEGNSINSIPIQPSNWSDYDVIIETGGQIWKRDGVYTVVASHASFPNAETTTFEYFHAIPTPIPPGAGPLGEEYAKATIVAKIYDLVQLT